MKIGALSCLLFFSSAAGAQSVYTFADFVNVGGDSLKQRYDNAAAQGRQGNTDAFWIAYEMSGRMNVRINSADGIDVVQRNNPERAAMFLLVRKSDSTIEKLRIVDLSREITVHERKVYWLGKPDSDESAGLLLGIARTSTSMQVRKDAVFWLGLEISRQAGDDLEKLATADPEVEVQKQVVFALSLRNSDESIPSLIRIAKEHANPVVRRQAIFWLGQKRDPRVLDFFEQLLKK